MATMNQELEAEVEQLITLQHFFMNLSESTLQTTLDFLAASKFVRNPDDFKEFLDTFFIFTEIRPLLIPNLVYIIKELTEMFPGLKAQFFHYFFLVYFNCAYDDFDCYMLHVLYRLMKFGVYSKEEIIDEFKKYYKISYKPRSSLDAYVNVIKHFYCFFAPEMFEVEEHFYNRVLSFFQNNSEESDLSFIISHTKNDFKLIKIYRETLYYGDPTLKIIIEDDIDSFMEVVSQPDFDINDIFDTDEISAFTTIDTVPLIGVVAALGATKCFKFLLSLNADLNFVSETIGTLAQAAMISGNIEIIRLLQQYNVSFDGTLPTCVRYFQNELFYWLHEQYYPDLEQISQTDETVLCRAAQSANYEILQYCISQGLDLNAGDGLNTPLNIASYLGHMTVVKVLCSLPSVDVNLENPLFDAIRGGQDDVFDFLFSHENVDIFKSTSDNPMNNMLHAIFYSNYHIVEKYMNDPSFDEEQIRQDEAKQSLIIEYAMSQNDLSVFKFVLNRLVAFIDRGSVEKLVISNIDTIFESKSYYLFRILHKCVKIPPDELLRMFFYAVKHAPDALEYLLEIPVLSEFFYKLNANFRERIDKHVSNFGEVSSVYGIA